MKKLSLMLLFTASICCVDKSAWADTCPPIDGLDPSKPPSGWSLLVPPVFSGENYYFSSAIYSLNLGFHFKKVICKYETCPSSFCPAFAILSEHSYEYPNSQNPPWDAPSKLSHTFTCGPIDHKPSGCEFSH